MSSDLDQPHVPGPDKTRPGAEHGRLRLTRRDKQVFGVAAGALSVISAVAGLVSFYVHSGSAALLWTFGILVAGSLGYLIISRMPGRTPRVPLLAVAAGLLVVAVAAGAIGAVIGYHLRSPFHSVAGQKTRSSPPADPYRSFSDPVKDGNVSAVAFSPDGKTLAVGDVNGAAFLFNVPADSLITPLRNPNGQSAWDVAYSPSGTTVADGTSDSKTYDRGSVYLWNVASPAKPIAAFRDPQGAGADTIAFSPDGKLLAAADGKGTVYLLDATTLKVAGTLQGPAHDSGYAIDGLAFSRDSRQLAGASSDGSLYVWNVAARALVSGPLFDPHNKDAKGVAFSPDGTLVAVADTNGHAYLWNLASGQVVKTFRDPADLQVMGVAFTPDGSALVTTSQSGKFNHDSAVRVWNAATGTLIHTFYDPGSYGAGRLAMSRDGLLLAVADQDAHAYVWRLDWLRGAASS